MITPAEIQQKAHNLYPKVLRAWLLDDATFFPKTIPAGKSLDRDNLASAIESVRALREGSKEARGYGYSVQWAARNSRIFGKNPFPERIFFETREDLLRLIGRVREFSTFQDRVMLIRQAFPQLENWLHSNVRLLAKSELEVEGLLHVVRYFIHHPRPNRFARELPLPVDTKFIERNQTILREWLDLTLPPHAIRADETHFERRYGLRYPEPHLHLCFLDPEIPRELSIPFLEISLPLRILGDLQIASPQALIVENKVNLLTLPPLRRGIGLGGLGKAVTTLRYIPWLMNAQILYWGDLDVEGFQILSSLRALAPQTQSFLMDEHALDNWRDLATPGTGTRPQPPAHLHDEELSAFVCCRDENLRIEQERIPHQTVCDELAKLLS